MKLTDEKIDELSARFMTHRDLARAIESELQAQASEPVAAYVYVMLDDKTGEPLYRKNPNATPQPAASCSRCVESDIRNVKNLNIIREQKEVLLYRANLLDKLQARCAEQTENVRISKELAVFNKQEAEKQYERANAAEARCAEQQIASDKLLLDECEKTAQRIELAVDWHLGRSAFTQGNKLRGFAHSQKVRDEIFAAHDETRDLLVKLKNRKEGA